MARNIFRKELAEVKPYIPGKPIEEVRREYGLARIEKLASNENPLGPSPLAVEAMRKELGNVNFYPDPTAADLRNALAAGHGLSPDHFIVSNGGEHLLQILAQVFINEGDEAIMAYPTFDIYASSVTLMGGKPVILPLKGYRQGLDRMPGKVTGKTKLVYVCNPNNPTGQMEGRTDVEAWPRSFPTMSCCSWTRRITITPGSIPIIRKASRFSEGEGTPSS
jgi:histidinol-phosphate aminotransferase